MNKSPRAIGDKLGAYRILGTIGQGGMGCVYLAEHDKLGRRAAIKMLHPELAQRPDHVARFFAEARAVGQLKHAGIVQIFDFAEDPSGDSYFAMELLEGEDMRQLLQRDGRLELPKGLELAAQMASALASVHEAGLVHGDLKPENVFIVADGQSKLLDFGVSTSVTSSPASPAGTPAYMAPELFAGALPGPATDIYAFGVLLFEMLVGRRPFLAASVAAMRLQHEQERPPRPADMARMPAALSDLIMQCLGKNAGERPASMDHIEAAIAHTLTFLEMVPQRRPRAWKWPVAVAASVLVVTGGFAISARATTSRVSEPTMAAEPPAKEIPTVVELVKMPIARPPREGVASKRKSAAHKAAHSAGDTGLIDAFAR